MTTTVARLTLQSTATLLRLRRQWRTDRPPTPLEASSELGSFESVATSCDVRNEVRCSKNLVLGPKNDDVYNCGSRAEHVWDSQAVQK